MKTLRILYAGDSPAGGPANYLLGILKSLKARVLHIPPDQKLDARFLKSHFDAILLSDYSKKQLPAASERVLVRQVEAGSGLLMVGGWGSFSGPYGGWKGSRMESLLPVTCLSRDDRKNFPGGAHVVLKRPHAMLDAISFKNPPAVLGLNEVHPKKNAEVILAAREIISRPGR